MTIILIDETSIKLVSANIALVAATPGNYTKIVITGNINCCTQNCEQQVSTLSIDLPQTLDANKAQIVGNDLIIYPPLFGLTKFTDGIYNFIVDIFAVDESITHESNCAFADLTYKCKVAKLLKYIVQENKTNQTEKISTIAHLLHYSIVNGSNCGCNCEEMCSNFRELVSIINLSDTQINNCGC